MDTKRNMNVKLEPSQAKMVFKFQNTKIQLLKSNLHIKFNKICLLKNITPKYAIVNINSSSKAADITKHSVERMYIREEIKALYIKKSFLNTRLFRLHLHILNSIHPSVINNVFDYIFKYTASVSRRIRSVSYTHLDVYKRQERVRTLHHVHIICLFLQLYLFFDKRSFV